MSAVYRVRFKEREMWAVGGYRCRDTLCCLLLSWWFTNKYIPTSGQKREQTRNTKEWLTCFFQFSGNTTQSSNLQQWHALNRSSTSRGEQAQAQPPARNGIEEHACREVLCAAGHQRGVGGRRDRGR